MDTNEASGGALLVGFVLVLLALYRNPAGGIDAATRGLQSALYFAVFPVLGALVGLYTYAGGRYSSAPVFLFGSYLGLFGLALSLGDILAPDPVGLRLVVGVVTLSLSVVALVGSLLRSVASVPVETDRLFPD